MLPEFQGCHAFPFPEQLDEMAGMMNSNLISNLLHRKRCFFQKDFRLIDTDANQILMNACLLYTSDIDVSLRIAIRIKINILIT